MIYSYDWLDRLTTADVTRQTATSSTQTISNYTYGPTGNILSSPAGSYTYAGSSGSSYANPHASTNVGSRSFAYDPAGNLLTDVGGSVPITNTWDYRNELATTLINIPGQRKNITYGYDASGMRTFILHFTIPLVIINPCLQLPKKGYRNQQTRLSVSSDRPSGSYSR